MPCRYVQFFPDQYYHLYNRGNNRQVVFFNRDNYLFFLHGIKKYLGDFLTVIAYCLMPTHYHMLVKIRPQPQQDEEVSARVSHAMQVFIISYTKAINKQFNRVGALFQGQFQAKLVTKDEQLLNLCIYIHTNPVKDGLVASPEQWEYSNYPEWIGMRAGTLVDRVFIEENFGKQENYRSLVMDFITSEDFRRLPKS